MKCYEKTITSGNIIEIERYFSTDGGKAPRLVRSNTVTLEQMQKINENNARNKLARLIKCNFTNEDIFLTLTYSNKCNKEFAKKELTKFIRKVRNYRQQNNLPELKYITTSENEKRMHHHIILNKIALDVLKAMWPHGRIMLSSLQADANDEYIQLANYIIKETIGKAKDEWAASKRWNCSRNLKKPIIDIKEINNFNVMRAPKEVIGIEKNIKKYRGFKVITYTNTSGQFGDYQYIKMVKQRR